MNVHDSPKVLEFFRRVLQMRGRIVCLFVLLTLAGIYGATRIPNDPAIDRLVVAGDATAQATIEFDRLFPEGEQALIMLEGPDPLSPAALRTADQLEQRIAKINGVKTHTLLDFFRRTNPKDELSDAETLRLRSFATGTPLFKRAGLLGDSYIGIGLELRVNSPEERNAALAQIDALVLPQEKSNGPFTTVRRVGSPWLNAWLEKQTGVATKKFMPLFGIFLVALVFIVYRSFRALGAIILTLGSVVAIGVGIAAIFGWSNTVVSTLVPLTVMVTTTATLVYLHSRYMEPDDAPTLLEHHARALANKFLPSTASMFATAVGFAALAVSEIRPVREMGVWTACGLVISWVGCFTLFPALQSLFKAPRRTEGIRVGRRYARFVEALLPFTRRYSWALIIAAIALMAAGAAALFGIPGRLAPLALETDALTYVNPAERVAQDTRRFQEFNGLDVVDLWIKTPPGKALDPEFLRAIDRFTQQLQADPRITAVEGPTSVLRWARYVEAGNDQLPADAASWTPLAADLEQILLTVESAREYVDIANLASVRLTVRGRAELFGRTGAMKKFVQQTWNETKTLNPALRDANGMLVGKSVLATAITERLLPTLTESFALTASIIFCAFLFVFRSPSARVMTMIPSLFAILSVFLVMRLTGIPLNIATILIGSTVLGATENDQVHFFYHFQEGRNAGLQTAGALQHAMLIAGRPIVFATLINASGFLALSFSDLPPMRQFGIVTSTAFVLALLADFTALPGALWILSRRERPRQ
ncbi:MAG: MMPL family transporter [Proteobacteria bacterium]|nr:MMPL family transporter [Pseudomonadota bacterium]